MIRFNSVLIKDKDVAFRTIEGEAVVISLKDQIDEKPTMYIFNETATKIWNLIDGKNSVKDIIERLREEYELDSKKSLLQIDRIIRVMKKKKLVLTNS